MIDSGSTKNSGVAEFGDENFTQRRKDAKKNP
jgi:hypothetical protein